MKVPVVFFFFNKLESTRLVFEQIKAYQPERLYLVSDGPRQTVKGEECVVAQLRKEIADGIDWKCDCTTLFSDTNMGCKNRIVSGLNEVFSKEEYAIILEDDCLPDQRFFEFCSKALIKYRYDDRIMHVSGSNLLAHKYYQMKEDSSFSVNFWIWGWATWSRAWKKYDPEIVGWNNGNCRLPKGRYLLGRRKELFRNFNQVFHHSIDTWDYQWDFCGWINNGLSIVPKDNLVVNIGFHLTESTHTVGQLPDTLRCIYYEQDNGNMSMDNITFSDDISRNETFDSLYDRTKFPFRNWLKGWLAHTALWKIVRPFGKKVMQWVKK